VSGDRDVVLLETVKTHRSRLVSALLFGELDERRLVDDNVRRLVVGLVIAAVACAGCAGTSFVLSVLADQRTNQSQTTGGSGGAVPVTVSPSPSPASTDVPDPTPTREPR
jgi:hypothetical protein